MTSNVIKCPNCQTILAKEDRRIKKRSNLVLVHALSLDQPAKQASRIKCPCGKTIVLIKGSL